jgi:hypothetical protein
MRGVELVNVTIDGEIYNLTINGVDVVPLVEAELDRRETGRPHRRSGGCGGPGHHNTGSGLVIPLPRGGGPTL